MSFVAQYSVIFLSGIVSACSLFAMTLWPSVSTFFTALFVWFGSLAALYLFSKQRFGDVFPLGSTLVFWVNVACLGLFMLIESSSLRLFLIVLIGLITSFIFFWCFHASHSIAPTQKRFRRIVTMIWVFTAYAASITLFAAPIFFQGIPFWLLSISGGVMYAMISFVLWRLYFSVEPRVFVVWLLLIALLLIELIATVHLLPFGYLTSGFFVTWLWYLLHLLFRFHLTPQGVVWKKQRWFLFLNAFFFTAALFFVRWI